MRCKDSNHANKFRQYKAYMMAAKECLRNPQGMATLQAVADRCGCPTDAIFSYFNWPDCRRWFNRGSTIYLNLEWKGVRPDVLLSDIHRVIMKGEKPE